MTHFPSPWAKLARNENGEVVARLPLLGHCRDVAGVCAAFLKNRLWRRRLANLGGLEDLDEVQRDRLAYLAGLHDFGKVNRGFQNRADPQARPKIGHAGEAVSILFECADPLLHGRLMEVLGLRDMLDWFQGGESTLCNYLLAVLWHHGRPIRPAPLNTGLWKPFQDDDPLRSVSELTAALNKAFPRVREQGGKLPDAPRFFHAFMGWVTLADWLGSDTRFFPLTSGEACVRQAHMPEKAASAVGLDSGSAAKSVPAPFPTFAQVFGFNPRPAQKILEELSLPHGPSTLVLEAETGSGKTEAALHWFFRLFAAGLVEGLYFALPTRAAALQIYHRVLDRVAAFFGQAAPPVVLAVPGYLDVDGISGRLLPGFEVLWPDEEAERLRYRGWAAEHPKRTLCGGIVVGTVDQVLLSALQVRHAHMRGAALLRHLLVVDEVHASDAYMTPLLEQVLSRTRAAGGHALLMSATLGSDARRRFTGTSAPSFDEALAAPYPCLTMHAEGVEAVQVAHGLPHREVRVERTPDMEDPVSVAGMALEAARGGARIAVLRNTVAAAVAVQEALEAMAIPAGEQDFLFHCGGVPAPHHGRFSRADRKLLDASLEARVREDRPLLVAATQTIEQSLDIDFDLLITDLCPMDVLLQRLGRLHRHRRRRPPGFELPRAVILTPEGPLESHLSAVSGKGAGPVGLGTVYEDMNVLQATLKQLEARPVLRLPVDCRELIESTTHSGHLEEQSRTWGEGFASHFEHSWGRRLSDRQTASLVLLDWTTPLDDPSVYFNDKAERIATRLGEEDRLCRFENPLPGPFGEPCSSLTLPARWCRDTPPDAVPEDTVAGEGIILFNFGPRRFRYDRWGLRPMDED